MAGAGVVGVDAAWTDAGVGVASAGALVFELIGLMRLVQVLIWPGHVLLVGGLFFN